MSENPQVLVSTSKGDLIIELYPDKTPETVKNFLGYVDQNYYDGLIFHRVISNFMIQGGGFTPEMKQKSSGKPIPNEADKGIPNQRGAIAMARTNDPHSATSQFFINTVDNGFLNFREKNMQGWGYAAFGKVIQGMEVVDQIAAVKTGASGMHQDVPVEPVIIQKIERLKTVDE